MKSSEARDLLEMIGKSFLTGYGYAAEAQTTMAAAEWLETVPTRFRGFAYEGAAMGFAIRDAMPFGGTRVAQFLGGRGAPHVYMIHVGVGWAMARLPRVRWSRIAPTDPTLRWLALDGYGFHQAYFRTRQYVHDQYRDDAFPWPADGPRWYANRVIDQGIGRAMWFVCGTDPDLVATTIEKFPEHRRADLFAGSGLAATYAGGADSEELKAFWERAGEYRPQVAQGSAFAAAARVRAGLVVPHNEVATQVFCGMTTEQAAQVSEGARPTTPVRGEQPAYEVWRQRIANKFVSTGRC